MAGTTGTYIKGIMHPRGEQEDFTGPMYKASEMEEMATKYIGTPLTFEHDGAVRAGTVVAAVNVKEGGSREPGIHYLAHIDESTPDGQVIADMIQKGITTEVSLGQTVLADKDLNIHGKIPYELTVCRVGDMPGARITGLYRDGKNLPITSSRVYDGEKTSYRPGDRASEVYDRENPRCILASATQNAKCASMTTPNPAMMSLSDIQAMNAVASTGAATTTAATPAAEAPAGNVQSSEAARIAELEKKLAIANEREQRENAMRLGVNREQFAKFVEPLINTLQKEVKDLTPESINMVRAVPNSLETAELNRFLVQASQYQAQTMSALYAANKEIQQLKAALNKPGGPMPETMTKRFVDESKSVDVIQNVASKWTTFMNKEPAAIDPIPVAVAPKNCMDGIVDDTQFKYDPTYGHAFKRLRTEAGRYSSF